MNRPSMTLLGIALMSVLLVALACGGDDEEAATTDPSGASTTGGAAAAPTQAPTTGGTTAAVPTQVAAPTATVAAGQIITTVEKTGALQALIIGALTLAEIQDAKYGGSPTAIAAYGAPSFDRTDTTGGGSLPLVAGFYNKLFEWNPFNPVESIPELATGWTLADDNKTYTITLRKDVQWHDGERFTADDVVGSWDYYLYKWNNHAKTSRIGGFLSEFVNPAKGVGSYDAVDDYTVRVILEAPSSGFLPFITSSQHHMLPEHLTAPTITEMEQKGVNIPVANADDKPPIGTGPFKYKTGSLDLSVEWERNENYWKKDPLGQDLPYLDGHSLLIVGNNTLIFAALRTGRIGWWPNFPFMGFAQADEIRNTLVKDGKARILEGSPQLPEGVYINMEWKFGSERDFRWAIALIMDQEEYKTRVFGGKSVAGQLLDPRVFPTFSLPQAELDTSPWRKQPKDEAHAEARTLLTGMGVTEATPLDVRIVCRNTSFYCAQAEVLSSQLNKFGGFNPKVEAYTPSVGSSRLREGLFEFNTNAAGVTVQDPLHAMLRFTSQTAAFRTWKLPNGDPDPDQLRVTRLVEEAKQELDPDRLKQIIWDIQRIFYFENLPNIPLGHATSQTPVWNYVKGFCNFGGIYECLNREYVWLDQ